MNVKCLVLLLVIVGTACLGESYSSAADPSALPPIVVSVKSASGKVAVAVNDRHLGEGDDGLKKLAGHMGAIFGGASSLPVADAEIQVRVSGDVSVTEVFKTTQAATGTNSRGKFVRYVNRVTIVWEK